MFKDFTENEMKKCVAIRLFVEGDLTRAQAAKTLNICERQVSRLATRYREQGPEGVKKIRVKRQAGFSQEVKERIFKLIDKHYWDYGPTLIAEKLGERHDIKISKETVRRFMIETGRWKAGKKKEQDSIH